MQTVTRTEVTDNAERAETYRRFRRAGKDRADATFYALACFPNAGRDRRHILAALDSANWHRRLAAIYPDSPLKRLELKGAALEQLRRAQQYRAEKRGRVGRSS